jgi:hypothetical protein
MPEEQPLLPEAEAGAMVAAEERLSTWAKNQSELAEAIGCDRKSIQRWLKAGDPDCPGHTSDGRYNVTLWKLWVESKGKKVRAVGKSKDKGTLEIENMRLRNEKLDIENMLRRGELMHVDEVNATLTELVSACVSRIRSMKNTLAPAVVGVSIPEATKRIDVETDEALNELALGDWAKKKPFWSSVYAHLQDLLRKNNLGDGLKSTSEIR